MGRSSRLRLDIPGLDRSCLHAGRGVSGGTAPGPSYARKRDSNDRSHPHREQPAHGREHRLLLLRLSRAYARQMPRHSHTQAQRGRRRMQVSVAAFEFRLDTLFQALPRGRPSAQRLHRRRTRWRSSSCPCAGDVRLGYVLRRLRGARPSAGLALSLSQAEAVRKNGHPKKRRCNLSSLATVRLCISNGKVSSHCDCSLSPLISLSVKRTGAFRREPPRCSLSTARSRVPRRGRNPKQNVGFCFGHAQDFPVHRRPP